MRERLYWALPVLFFAIRIYEFTRQYVIICKVLRIQNLEVCNLITLGYKLIIRGGGAMKDTRGMQDMQDLRKEICRCRSP
jgi:hypothetical protein